MFRSALGKYQRSVFARKLRFDRRSWSSVNKEDLVNAASLQKFVDYFGPFEPAMISRVRSTLSTAIRCVLMIARTAL